MGGRYKTEPRAENAPILSYDPATGRTLGQVPVRSAEQVRASVDLARAAQVPWAALSFDTRRDRMLRFRQLLLDEAEDLARRISRENGKTLQEALVMEVLPLVDLVGYYAHRAERILAPRKLPLHLLKHRASYVHHVPRGVVGVVSPWNFPLVIPIGEVAMAIIAGNGVVLKPSEITPLIALHARELFVKSGMPGDLFQVVTGDGRTGQALIEAGVDQIFFTGSVATGKKVAAACGERLIPCVTELGGKAPALVCADADLERTSAALTWGGFANSGQICASVERVYAVDAIHDELVRRIVAQVRRLRQGDPQSTETDVGAICFPRQIRVAEDLVADAVARGATVATGGHPRLEGGGMFFEPTVLVGVTQDMRVAREEIFGPVLPILRVADEEEGLRLANDSHLGLLAYVFSRDRARARRLAERIEAGTVMVNDVLSSYGMPETPWGGLKQSGIGFVHGEDGLRNMCQPRHINYDRLSLLSREPWWYPYGSRSYRWLLRAMRVVMSSRIAR